MAMWDWEIISYLRAEGVEVMAPYSLDGAKTACRALAASASCDDGEFLVYQDHPGEGGSQPSIFKRFYWWEDECSQRIRDRFGLRIVKSSFEELGARAKAIPDAEAAKEWVRVRDEVPLADVSDRATLSAVKLYRAVRDDLDHEDGVLAVGINCLNESALLGHHALSGLGPALQRAGDDLGLRSRHRLHAHQVHRAPFPGGPGDDDQPLPVPDGPGGASPRADPGLPRRRATLTTTSWRPTAATSASCPGHSPSSGSCAPRALAIVDENATAIDARLPIGELTLAKLGPTFDTLSVVEGELTGYAGFPGSDCLNGAVIRVPDGHALMERLPSHHSVLLSGHDLPGLKLVGQIFGFQVEKIGG